MLAESHDEAEIDMEEGLYEEGGPATYVDIQTFDYDPETSSTPDPIEIPYQFSALPIKAESGWMRDGLVNVTHSIFLASTKQLRDLGIIVKAGEKITFNGVTYTIQFDIPYLAGKGAIGHQFVCVIS